ncbi:hypothetical protein AYI70_g4877 [Smittium culicis]|uniref:Uncharacterized protein n=1 Tax=Smittium culicis TaxID=133412 RepID=A0A1R1X626_9FUNG|nr:hypothetical protein AYI70_g10574 [Smittium culicis]OMJ19184.1 hypothetical protein AYI70_g4877 [Smittium culicis]
MSNKSQINELICHKKRSGYIVDFHKVTIFSANVAFSLCLLIATSDLLKFVKLPTCCANDPFSVKCS